jgi:hypothetical protein
MAQKATRAAGRRKATRRTPRPRPGGEELEHPVRVRMYRLGLGECFLLSFARLGVPFHMLIDCGIAPASRGRRPPIGRVVEDIQRTTRGRLDVLVVTYRRWDRISGFFEARSIFERMAVDQVWLGWTEDPHDVEARRLAPQRGFGTERHNKAMDVVRRMGGRETRYWRGGDGPVALSGVTGSRVFFLAPPTTHGGRPDTAPRVRITESPFDPRYRVKLAAAREDARFAQFFAQADGWRSPTALPDQRASAGRAKERIPPMRLDAQHELNNTSLAIAIELAGPRGERKVLLFPGDAQVASWWTWHDHRWPPDDPNGMTCARLLRNTVLYKVSHHGSWSGTPSEFGLDMMTSPELVAMIPVDQEDATKQRWQMPAPAVLAALTRATRGRVIRADTGVPASAPGGGLAEAEWDEFRDSVHVDALYIDYHVRMPQLSAGEREKLQANWTAANDRRVFLLDKRRAGTIRPEEEAELREIDRLVDEYMKATAPTDVDLLAGLRASIELKKTEQ